MLVQIVAWGWAEEGGRAGIDWWKSQEVTCLTQPPGVVGTSLPVAGGNQAGPGTPGGE